LQDDAGKAAGVALKAFPKLIDYLYEREASLGQGV